MKEFNLSWLWKLLWKGKYIILGFALAGFLLAVYALKVSPEIYELNITSLGNSFLFSPGGEDSQESYFFQKGLFFQGVRPFLKGVSLSHAISGEKVVAISMRGEKKAIGQALNTLRGLYIKFRLSRFMAKRASVFNSMAWGVVKNRRSLVFFKKRIELLKKLQPYYPKEFSRDSFVFQQVEILPPKAQEFVFRYRIINRQASDEINLERIEEEKARLKRLQSIINKKPSWLGQNFCSPAGKALVKGDLLLETERDSLCVEQKAVFSQMQWRNLPNKSPSILVSWSLAGFSLGVFMVLLFGILMAVGEVKNEG